MALKNRLRESLDYSGKKQIEIAARLGITRSAVSDWFSGKTKEIKSKHLLELANFLGVDAEWLDCGKGKMLQSSTKTASRLSEESISVAAQYMKLSIDNRQKIDDYLNLLVLSEK